MFLLECPTCGRRELRGPRSLTVVDGAFVARCRACGSHAHVAGHGHAAATPDAA